MNNAIKNRKKTNSKKKQPSSVRHTRAIALDRSKRPTNPPPPAHIEQVLNEVVQPATFNLLNQYQQMGLRARVLNLPVMLAFVLSLIWRQIGAVSEAVRVLNQEGLLWQGAVKVSQQAVSERLRDLPASLFEAVFDQIVPIMHQRYEQRRRPIAPQMQTALRHFSQIVAWDGSTLDALCKKTGLLRETPGAVLAGKIMAVLDLAKLLPVKLWYSADSAAHDQNWWPALVEVLKPESLALFDLGFVNYAAYAGLTEDHKYFVSRVKSNMVYQPLKILSQTASHSDWLVQVGDNAEGSGQILRVVGVPYGEDWYYYLTNVLDPSRLSVEEIAYLYRQRWRIEDAFRLVKRLLGLAYFHSGSINAIQLQVWATWLLYCVLIDLTDGVAEELKQPLSVISVEMVYRGLYHYSQALTRGVRQSVFEYLASHAKLLGIIKRKRPKVGVVRSSDLI